MPTNVILHVYDVSASSEVQKVNQYLTAVGTGAFHGGLEIYGTEWSYGYSESGTGVFSCPPKGCTAHHYRESHEIGQISLSESQVKDIIEKMKTDWPGKDYDLLRHNCVIFSDTLSRAVGAGPLPAWLTNLAGAGATLCDGAISAVTQAQAAAIIAKAKAGEIDEKYNVRGTAQVKGAEFVTAMQGLDKKYQIQANATDMAGKAAVKGGELANQAAAKAKEMDDKYKLQEKATDFASQAAAKGSIFASQAAAKAQQMNEQYQIGDKAKGLADQAVAQAKVLSGQPPPDTRLDGASGQGVVVEGDAPKTAGFFGCCG